MILGNLKQLRSELTKIFGECYTDDNAVVLVDGDQKTVAYLEVRSNDKLIVQFVDERSDVVIKVKGARPDARNVQFFN